MENVEDIYALSPMQQGMLFHSVSAPREGLYVEQKVCTLKGPLDRALFRQAWQHATEQLPALRTAFLWEGLDEPVQIVRRAVELPWLEQDLRHLRPARQQETLQAFVEEDRAKGLPPSMAPLMRVALLQTADDVHELVWTHHHLILDGWSLPLIYREVFSAYLALLDGQSPPRIVSRPYREYIRWLQKQDRAQAAAFWRSELGDFYDPTPLPMRLEIGQKEREDEIYGEAAISLTPDETERLRSFARSHALTVNTLVQAAWGLLLCLYNNSNDVVFGATVSGRPADLPGVESMVGIFINTLPVRLRVRDEQSLLECLKDLQNRQVEMRQYEYSALTEVQGFAGVPRDAPLFESILVYENYPTNPASAVHDPRIQISNLRSLERGSFPIIVKAADGAALYLGALYDSRAFPRRIVMRVLRQMGTLLNAAEQNANATLAELRKHFLNIDWSTKKMERRTRRARNTESFLSARPKRVELRTSSLVRKSYLNDQRYPLVLEPINAGEIDAYEWVSDNRDEIERDLFMHGAILFRGFGFKTVQHFEQFASAICPELYGEYGDLPPETSGKKVYQSTPYPNDKPILFHNESSHMHCWPMRQWFFCMKASAGGGETPVVDCRRVYNALPREVAEKFRRKGLRYTRNFIEGLDVSWQDFFDTEDKGQVEEYCRANGFEYAWKDHGLRISHVGPAVARHPRTGEHVFFNQIQLHHTALLDPELRQSVASMYDSESYPRNVTYGDGTPIEDELVHELVDLYWNTAVSFPWLEGDVIMVDNMLTAHARKPFTGDRKIVVALAEMINQRDVDCT